MQRRRPAAQRSDDLKIIGDSRSPGSSVSDKYNVTKSETDLLDTKYVEFRRPWYGNPNYKGPTNFILSPNQLQSPKGNFCDIKEDSTLPRNYYPKAMYRNSAHQMYNQSSSRRKNSKISITESEPLNNTAFFSFENLSGDKGQTKQNLTTLSSSPESVFSAQISSRSSSRNRNYLENNQPKDSTYRNRPMPKKAQSKYYYTSPRHGAYNVEEEWLQTKYDTRPELTSSILNSNRSITTHDKLQRNNEKQKEKLIVDSEDPPYPNKLPRNSLIDYRLMKSWKKRGTVNSDDSDLTSVTDDDYSSSSLPSRRSYHRPLPKTNQAECEALFYIFSYLDMKTLSQCGAVNRLWYNISREPILWKRIRMKDCQIFPNTFFLMSRWCTKVKEISLHRIKQRINIGEKNKKEDVNRNLIEVNLVKLFTVNKDTIKIIRIIDCDDTITGGILWSISTHCQNITKLVYLSKKYPLGQEDLYPLGKGCPAITSLIIPPGWPCLSPEKFNDLCCESISKCWLNLQVLCIGGRKLTIYGLQHIAKDCVKLQHLEIDHGPEITEESASKLVTFGFRGLVKLDFTFTPVSPRAVVIFNNACPKLSHIGIHCNISDYFPDHESSKAKANYHSLKTLFRRLKTRPGFNNVLDINLDYEVETLNL